MELLNFLQIGLVIKLFYSVLLLFYFVFCVIVYRQISLMSQVLATKYSPLVRFLALIQIIGAVFLFFLGIIII